MSQCRRDVCENLTIHLLPTTTECVILRQVSTVHGVYHTIEHGTVILEIAILVVILTVEFRVMCVHAFDDVTLNHQEPGGTVKHLDESVCDWRILVLEVHDERCRRLVEVLTSGDSLFRLFPHNNLLGVDGTRHVVTRRQETQDGFRLELNVGVDEQKVRRIRLLNESCN